MAYVYSAGGLPSFESVVDQTGRVRRRALIPENEEYRTSGSLADAGRGPSPAGGDDDNASDENDSIDDVSEDGDQDDQEIESDDDYEQEEMEYGENGEVKLDDETDTEVLPKKRKAHVRFFFVWQLIINFRELRLGLFF
jgi:cobalamin biosynthesis protein CobT